MSEEDQMVRLVWVLAGHTVMFQIILVSAHMFKHGWKLKFPELSKFKSLNLLYVYKVLSISNLNGQLPKTEYKSEDIKICLI